MGGLQPSILGQTMTFSVERGKFVLFVKGNHWITISNVRSAQDEIYVYDSMYSRDLPNSAKRQIAAIICTVKAQFTLNFQHVQHQKGSGECGLFAIAFAETLCSEADPTTVRYSEVTTNFHMNLDT